MALSALTLDRLPDDLLIIAVLQGSLRLCAALARTSKATAERVTTAADTIFPQG